MATITMVGSAVAFSKTQAGLGELKRPCYENQSTGQTKIQAGGEDTRGLGYKNQTTGHDWTEAYSQSCGGNQKQGRGTNYKDTFHQMMMWK